MARLGEATRTHGCSRILLVTDPGLEKSGHPQRAEKILHDAGLKVTIFDGVKENPTEKEVAAGVEAAKKAGIDSIVAVGGGSTMDCAKGINFIYTNGGKMADYKGHDKASQPMLPGFGVPTTSGTGSEAQSYALISDPVTHMKMACGDKKVAFKVSILDPELTLTQPRTVTAVTGIDALAHAIESYVCNAANPISQMASLAAFQQLEPNFGIVLESPNDLNARSAMQLGAYFAGMAIESSMLGVCHSCANPLTAKFGTIHGTAIGLLLPSVIRFNAKEVNHLYHQLSGHDGEWLANRISGLVQQAGLPGKLREIGVKEQDIPQLAEQAEQQWTATFNPRKATRESITEIYTSAW